MANTSVGTTQVEATGNLARCKQLLEVATALRAALYARAQSLQLLRGPFPVDALDMSLFRQPGDSEAAAASTEIAGAVLQALHCT